MQHPQANRRGNLPDTGGMHVVEALSDARAFDTSGRESFALTAGLQYVVHDLEAEGGVRDGAFKSICKLDEMLPRYDGQPLANERVLITHIGGMGDGLVLATCLKALKDRYPDCTIDVPCPALHHPLMKLVDADLNIMPYPPPAVELKHYSYYMSLEDVDRYATDPAMSNIQIFGKCLRTPEAGEAVTLKLPSALLEEWDIGPARQPRVGIALTKSAHMKAYPVDLALKLVQALLKKGVAVLLFGASNEIGRDLPHAPPMLFNLVDKTPDIQALAAIFSQLDAMVCPDTMFMHLAGALRVPTLTIFTCTHVSAAGGYPTVRLASADVPCRPCGAVGHTCPIGHNACIVPRHADLAPKRLADAVMDLLEPRQSADHSPLAKMSDSR